MSLLGRLMDPSIKVAYEQGFSDAIQAAADHLEWLADGRAEYGDQVRPEVDAARVLARLLRAPGDSHGWLPSWLWDKEGPLGGPDPLDD